MTGAEGQNEPHGQYIETVPTKGYRFTAAVTYLDETPPPDDSLADVPAEPARRQGGGRTSIRWALGAACALIMVVLVVSAWRALGQHGTPALPGSRRPASQTNSGAAFAKFQSGRLHLDRHLDGDIETSLDDFEAAIRLDPAFAAAYAGEADARMFRYWDTGAHDDIAQARVAIRKAIQIDPESSYAHALRFLVRYRESAGARPEEIASLRQAFATGGWRAVLRASLPKGPPPPSLETAGTFAQLGDVDAAFDTLEAMISARRVMVVRMDGEPRLDPLRSDPRFAQLVRRVGLRQP